MKTYVIMHSLKSKSNEQCANCPQSHLAVNGRYCKKLKRYVEYAVTPLCEKKIKNKIDKK